MVTDDVISVLDAAGILGVDVADAYGMIFSGDLPAVPGRDGRFLVRRRDLLAAVPTSPDGPTTTP